LDRREFTVSGEYQYNRTSPVRWIVSHIWRYPWLPIVAGILGIIEAGLFSYAAVVVGQAFDLMLSPERSVAVLIQIALLAFAVRFFGGACFLLVSWSFERADREAAGTRRPRGADDQSARQEPDLP
jgi:hypothetical protein